MAVWRYSGRECHAVDACGEQMLSLSQGQFSRCNQPAGHGVSAPGTRLHRTATE